MLDNLRRLAKLSQIFDPNQMQEQAPVDMAPQVTPDMMPPPNIEMMPPQPGMMGMEEPNQPFYDQDAENRINDLLSTMPVRQDPTMLNRIGSAMTGIAHGPEAQKTFLNRKHDTAMQDWNAKFKPSMEAANLERYGNANKRLIASQEETARKNRKVEEDRDRRLTEQERQNKENESTRAIRAKAYDYRARNPNHILKEDESGHIIAVDPITNKTTYLLDDLGQKIKSSKMPEEDKVNLQITGAERVARVRGAEARSTKATTSGDSNGDSPNQQKIAQYLRAREYFNQNPAIQKFLKLGDPGTNDFQLVGPSQNAVQKALGLRSGPTEEEFNAMKEFIYGPGGEPTVEEEVVEPETKTAPPVKPSKLAAKAPKGRINIYEKDGTLKGSIPDTPEQRAKAKEKGYTVK